MEAVTQFNNELTGLHDCKPPISKAKMTSITKAAIKSVKLYKHVVQGVEKFIQKCRSEFKVPGLYVIDSIVRQSRHQFGPDKDVFATRFARNFNITFQNLFKCPAEEKPKIVRVLNLWQKNAVFSADVIQPLLDMANPNHVIHQQATPTSTGTPGTNSVKKLDNMAWNNWGNENSEGQSDQSDSQLKPLMQLMQSQQMLPFSAMSNVFQGSSQANSNDAYTDNTLVMQFQQIANLLSQQADTKRTEQETVKFNKKLLDFDYSDEEEEEDEKKEEPVTQNTGQNLALNMAQNLLSNPDLLKQLQQMQQTLQQTELLKTELSMQEQLSKQRMWSSEELMQSINSAGQNQAYGLQAQQMQMSHVPYEMPQVPPLQQSVVNVGLAAGNIPLPTNLGLPPSFVPIPPVIIPPSVNQDDFEIIEIDKNTGLDARINEHHQYDDHSLEDMETSENESSRPPIKRRERTRSRSPSRSRRRGRRSRSRSKTRRSRSRSSSRTRKYRRGDRRSRSKERDREREKEKEREKEREKEKERKKRGLPPLKKDFLSVCSTTLWLGHVSKLVSEEDLADQFGEFGDIVTIDLIPPRGCAFVCMNRRQDAYRALTKLKNLKLHGKSITMAWAPGKGVKGKDYKDYWDADLGVSYIPFEKIPDNVDLEGLEDGGMMDEDSMSDRLKEQQKAKESVKNRGKKEGEIDASGDKKDEKEIILNGSVKSASITIDSSSALPISIPQMPQYGLSNMVSGQNLSMMQMMAPNVGQASLLGHPVAGNLSGGVNMSLVGSFNMANSAASMVLGGHSSSILENLTKEAKKLKDTPDVKDTNTSVGLQQEIKKSESLDSSSAADKLDTSTSSIPLPPENGLKSAFDTSSIDSTRNALVGDVKNIDPSASSLALGVAMNSLAAPLTGGVGAPFSSMAFSSSGVMPMTGVTQGFQNAMDFGIQNPFQAPPPFNPMMPPPLFQPCFPLMRPLGSTSDNSLVSPNDLPKLGQWRPNFPAPNSHQRSNNFQDKDSKLSDATRNPDNNLDKMSRDLGGNKLSPRSAGHHLSGSNRLRPPGPLNDTRHDRGAAPDLVDDQGTHRSLNREAMLDHIDPPLLGPRHGSRFGHPPSRFGDFDDGEGFRLPRPGDLNSNNDFPPDVRMRFMPRGPGLPGPPRPMMGRFPMGPRMGGPPGFPRFPPSVLPHRGHPDRPPGFQGMMPPGRGGFPLPLRAPVRGPHPMDRNRLDMGRDRMLHDRHFGGGPPDFDFDPEQPEFNRFEDRDRREGNFRRDGPHHADWHHLPRDRRDSWKESEDEFDRELRPDLRERRTEERREHSRPPVGEWGRGRDNNKEEVRGREERNSRWERSRDRDRDRDTDRDRDRDREIDRDRDRETDRDRDREKRDRRDSDRDHTTKLDKSIDSHENYKKLINKEEVQFNVKEEEVHFNAKEEVHFNAKEEVQYNAKDEVQFNAKEEVHFDVKEDEKENIAIFDAVKEEETPFTSTELVNEPAEELFGLVKEDCNDGSVINAADE